MLLSVPTPVIRTVPPFLNPGTVIGPVARPGPCLRAKWLGEGVWVLGAGSVQPSFRTIPLVTVSWRRVRVGSSKCRAPSDRMRERAPYEARTDHHRGS